MRPKIHFCFFETLHGNKPSGKKPRCVSTRKNAYGSHVGLPRNDHEFMKKRSKALTEPLLKTRTLLETIFHDFWSILGSKTEWVFLFFLTFSAQGPPRPSKTPPDLSQDPPRAPQGHQKGPQDGPRRLPKHPGTPTKGSKVSKIPPRRTQLPVEPGGIFLSRSGGGRQPPPTLLGQLCSCWSQRFMEPTFQKHHYVQNLHVHACVHAYAKI